MSSIDDQRPYGTSALRQQATYTKPAAEELNERMVVLPYAQYEGLLQSVADLSLALKESSAALEKLMALHITRKTSPGGK